jgi:hypothetical protein
MATRKHTCQQHTGNREDKDKPKSVVETGLMLTRHMMIVHSK